MTALGWRRRRTVAPRVVTNAITFLTVAACGGGATASSSSPLTSSPARAVLTLSGDARLSGPVTIAAVRCYEPTLKGSAISVVGRRPDIDNLSILIQFMPGSVKVTIDNVPASGFLQGAFADRNFRGSGVSGFDSRRGVTVNSPLGGGEASSASGTGDLGVISSISGHVECGNQTPGESSIVLTGDNQDGTVRGGLSSARVECATGQVNSVLVNGLTTVGSTRLLVTIFISSDLVEVDLTTSTKSLPPYFSQGRITGTVNVSVRGARVDATLPQQVDRSYTLHISGDATCGSTLRL